MIPRDVTVSYQIQNGGAGAAAMRRISCGKTALVSMDSQLPDFLNSAPPVFVAADLYRGHRREIKYETSKYVKGERLVKNEAQ